MTEGKGLNNPKFKGMIRELLLDWTETLEMKENNRVTTVIDHTIDVLARLVEYQSSKPINHLRTKKGMRNWAILEVRPSNLTENLTSK